MGREKRNNANEEELEKNNIYTGRFGEKRKRNTAETKKEAREEREVKNVKMRHKKILSLERNDKNKMRKRKDWRRKGRKRSVRERPEESFSFYF